MREVAGLHVTVGELSWIDNGLGNAVDSWNGHGVFSVVRLPAEQPGAAVRLRRPAQRPRADGDEFRQRFRTITDTPAAVDLVAEPALLEAHVRGEIAPWTLIADELFTVEPTTAPVTPTALESASRRALRIIELLGLLPPGLPRAPLPLPDPDLAAIPPPDSTPDPAPPPDREPDRDVVFQADEASDRGAVTHPDDGVAPAR